MQSLGNGIKQDFDAVINSLRFNENNGFLEGNVNRLKAIKRSMFGRAKFPLLNPTFRKNVEESLKINDQFFDRPLQTKKNVMTLSV